MIQQTKNAQMRKIGAFQLKSIQISGEGEYQSLDIELQHPETLNTYDLAITLPALRQNKMFSLIFETLEQFRDSLLNSWSELKVTKEANIIYPLQIHKKRFLIELKGKKRQMNNTELLIRQTAKSLQSKIKELQQKLLNLIQKKCGDLAYSHSQMFESLSQRDKQIDEGIQRLKLKFEEFPSEKSNKSNITNAKLQTIQAKLADKSDKLKTIEETISNLAKSVANTNNLLQNSKKSQQQQIINLSKQLQFDWNCLNPHSSSFILSQLNNKLVITKRRDGYHSFIKYLPIRSNAVTNIRFLQTKTVNRDIMTGIATNSIFGQERAYKKKESLFLYSQNGDLYQKGVSRQLGRTVLEGEEILMKVDTLKWEITWSVGNQKLAQTAIPQQIRNKPLFIVGILFDTNDVMEIS